MNYIEINPQWNWFADPTPLRQQRIRRADSKRSTARFSAELQTSHFPATMPPGALEVGYRGAGLPNGTLVSVPVNSSATGQIIPANPPMRKWL